MKLKSFVKMSARAAIRFHHCYLDLPQIEGIYLGAYLPFLAQRCSLKSLPQPLPALSTSGVAERGLSLLDQANS